MKQVKIILFLIMVILVTNTSECYAFSLCEMSGEYKKWQALSDEEKQNFIEPPYCASTYQNQYAIRNNSNMNELDTSNYISAEELKTKTSLLRYNAAEEGVVTSVKDQASTNSCWAFTSNSLIETRGIIEGLGTLDLSERHIEYSVTRNGFTDGTKKDGLNRVVDEGGNSYYSSSYYFRHEGPVNETTMPFQTTNKSIALTDLPQPGAAYDIDTFIFNYYNTYSACSPAQIAAIKENIVKYGSAGASMYYADSYLGNKKYYYYMGNLASNHAVTIVGWDDTVPTSMYKHTPSSAGAWIIKNSWGTTHGENGYIYISYSDTKICGNSYVYSGVQKNDYDNAYYSAEYLSSYSLSLGGNTNYVSTKFTKKSEGTEYLDKVSLEVITGNTYEVYLSQSNTLDSTNDWILLGKGSASSEGVFSVRFDPIAITGDYTIIVKRTGTGYFIPLMCSVSDTSSRYYELEITKSTNYTSNDGKNWTDTSSLTDSTILGCEPVIYAYTRNEKAESATYSIDSITGSKTYVYAKDDYYYNVKLSMNNIISYDLFDIAIYNTSGTDVTTKFDIDNYIANGKLVINMNTSITPGTYTLKVKYGTETKEKTFVIYEELKSNKYTINGTYIIIHPGALKELTRTTFLGNLNVNSSNYRILSASNEALSSSSTTIGTGMQLENNGVTYKIVLIGDTSGDGKIKSNDALLISRHLVKLTTLDAVKLLAADTSGDSNVKSNDALLISRFLVGLKTSL